MVLSSVRVKMIKLKDLVPVNLASEKEKFFAKQANYNPQFQYQKPVDVSSLNYYGKSNCRYAYLAKKIIKQAQKENLFQQEQSHNNILSEQEVKNIATAYLDDYALSDKYQIIFSETFTSRFAVNFLENSIKIRLPINFNQQRLINSLDHEIGTHVLRQENYLLQPWYKRKKAHSFRNHLLTEEGLAVIHQYLNSDQQLVFQPALSYLGVQLASKADYKTVYQFYYRHHQDPQKAWSQTLKNKRGLTDTSLPGGFSKGLVYLTGFAQVLKYLRRQHYDPSSLYYGKLAFQDVKKAQKIKPNYQALLPRFYTADPQAYREKIQTLAKRNFIF